MREILTNAAVFFVFMAVWVAFWSWLIRVVWEAFGEWLGGYIEFPG